MATVVDAVASFAFLAVMFVPLERAWPAVRPTRSLRAGMAADVAFFFGQHLVFAAAAAWVITTAVGWLPPVETVAELRRVFGTLPLWARVVAVIVLGDLVAYWAHRLQHRVDWLWRFHGVHHSSESVDWLAAHREHPLDGLYTQSAVNLPAILLGFDLSAVLGLVAFRSLWAIFIHSNVSFRLGPLGMLLGSPAHHRWHHAKDRDTGNYANLAPWIDWLFGTHHLPAHDPPSLGLVEPMPRSYLGLLVHPFRRRAAPDTSEPVEPANVALRDVALPRST